MNLEDFAMERMQSEWENKVAHNLSESGVEPMRLDELLGASEFENVLSHRLGYGQSNGTEELRSAIAGLYRGADLHNVVVASGTAEANFISTWQLVEPGDDVVMILPNYMQVFGLVRSFGARIVPLWLKEGKRWAPDLGELRELVSSRTRLIVVCNPNNPTGAVLSHDEMRGIVAQAETHGAWILADEVYRGAELAGHETPTFWGMYDRLLVTAGLSKAYGVPGLRIGWVLGPREAAARLWARKDYLTISPSSLSDLLARKALSPRNRPRILERTRSILRRNYAVFETWAKTYPALSWVPPRAGAIVYLRYSWPVRSLDLVLKLRNEQNVLVVPGAHFEMDGYLRLGYGNELKDLESGLASTGVVFRAFLEP